MFLKLTQAWKENNFIKKAENYRGLKPLTFDHKCNQSR
jgi:hypothetical protein